MVTSLVLRIGYLARNRITTRLIFVAVALCGLTFRVLGLGRSLWQDEAWVANSVTAGSLANMFYYDSWLQTSPPLFLLLTRITVATLGLSNSAFRLIPLLFGLLSATCMFVLARQVLSPRFALLAWTMFALAPLAIEYSRTLKPYSLELAATTTALLACSTYLERPTSRRFWMLLATAAVGSLMAYAVVFVMPGIILVVCLAENQFGSAMHAPRTRKWGSLMRGLILAAVVGGIFVVVYLLFASPNTSSDLRSFWAQDRRDRSFARVAITHGYGLLTQLPIPIQVLDKHQFVCAAVGPPLVLIGFALAYLRFRKGRRRWLEIQIICALPCLLLIICSGLSWYPITARMGLFLLPAIVLLIMSSLLLISHFVLHRFRRKWIKPLLDVVLVCATLLVLWGAIVKQPISAFNVPEEDVASTISFLRSNVQREDLLWVHASCSEAFKLYAKMTAWSGVAARFGRTGWPCCPRGMPARKGSGTEEAVRRDLNEGIPSNFSGKVWLLYTKRTPHWDFVGIDESRIMDSVFRKRGCLQKPTPFFHNMGVSFFDCRVLQGSIAKNVKPSRREILIRER
jgi:dolichyl-phosphate-mannose-protein mannosyltransferase